jgi:hypothetical protein
MFGLDKIVDAVSNVVSSAAQLASSAAELATAVAPLMFPQLAIAQAAGGLLGEALGGALKDVASQLCKESGMPKFVQDLLGQVIDKFLSCQPPVDHDCKQACGDRFGDAIKDFAQDFGKSVKDFAQSIMDLGNDRDCEGAKGGGKGGKSAGSWLVAIAKAMGAAAGEHAKKLVDLSQQIEQKSGASGDAAKEVTGLQAEFQAESQMFSMLQSSFSNAIKSIGEGMSQMARKG